MFGKKEKLPPCLEEITTIVEILIKHLVDNNRKAAKKFRRGITENLDDLWDESLDDEEAYEEANRLLDEFLSEFSDAGVDMEKVFAGENRYNAKKKVDDLINVMKKKGAIPFRLTRDSRLYIVYVMKENGMPELKKILAKYGGRYDHHFDLDIYNMIKIAKPPQIEKITIPPLSMNSVLWKNMEAVVKAIPPTKYIENDLKELRESLSKERVIDRNKSKEQAYWDCMLSAIDSYCCYIPDYWAVEDIIDDIRDIVDYYDVDIDFDNFYIPKDTGVYKALSIIAEELSEQNILVGWTEGPDEIGKQENKNMQYHIVIVKSDDKRTIEKLFIKCGGVIHFDFNDAKRLATPLKKAPVIDWHKGNVLPSSE
jgi:hypothetical protein